MSDPVDAPSKSKARLVPLYFAGRDDEFYRQVERLVGLLAEEAEILEPVALGAPLAEAENDGQPLPFSNGPGCSEA